MSGLSIVQSSAVATIPPPPLRYIEIGSLHLTVYGLLIAVGAIAATWLARRRYESFDGDPSVVEGVALWAVLGGMVGARLGFVLPRFDEFVGQPLAVFSVWDGGLVFFGGLAGGSVSALWYLRRNGVGVAGVAHAAAPAIPLGHAIGRWGCYFNQELYGRPTDVPWALEVEPAYRIAPFQDFQTFHPAFLYESLWNLMLVALLLWIDRRFALRRGSLFFLYLIGYGVGRFWIEMLRVDADFRILGLSRNNLNALLIVSIGSAGLWWWETRKGRSKAGDAEPVDVADEEAPASTDATHR